MGRLLSALWRVQISSSLLAIAPPERAKHALHAKACHSVLLPRLKAPSPLPLEGQAGKGWGMGGGVTQMNSTKNARSPDNLGPGAF
jgi:hypothetical protein